VLCVQAKAHLKTYAATQVRHKGLGPSANDLRTLLCDSAASSL
jgi:hypothetical protein